MPSSPARKRDDAWYRSRLALPTGKLRIVLDTDTANEIDDQFALAWVLLSQDRLVLEAVYAAPFSFAHRRAEMLRARGVRADPGLSATEEPQPPGSDGGTPDSGPFNPPGVGMERSYQEIITVFEKLRMPHAGRVFRGSDAYLAGAAQARPSEAVDHLIRTARSCAPGETLYVVAIGCVTNIASALLLAPDIVDQIVVVWTSGFPSHAPHVNNSFNLEQDMAASTVLFDSGVPLVYLPGYQVGAQLRLSLPEMERCVKGRGAIGDYLHQLFMHNPLLEFSGGGDFHARSWVIWDVINVAWLLNPDWVPSGIVSTPVLGQDRRWSQASGRPPMREAYGVARDAIFRDFFQRLETAPA